MKEQVFFRAFDDVVDRSEDSGDSDIIEVKFVISTPKKDRGNDTVAIDGWDLSKFEKNPVVLWAHDKSMLPIGRAFDTHVKGKRLLSKTRFTPQDYAHQFGAGFGYTVGRMYKDGFLNTVSVGFRALAWDERQDGIDFKRQELLEYSPVPIPMNPEALAVARDMGIDTKPLYRWCEYALDNKRSLPPLTVSDKLVNSTYKSLKKVHAPSIMQKIFKHKKKTKKEKKMEETKEALKALLAELKAEEQAEDQAKEMVDLIKRMASEIKELKSEVRALKEEPATEPQSDDDDELDVDVKMLGELISEQVKSAVEARIKALG